LLFQDPAYSSIIEIELEENGEDYQEEPGLEGWDEAVWGCDEDIVENGTNWFAS
jgi:hypothetical protein